MADRDYLGFVGGFSDASPKLVYGFEFDRVWR